MKIASIVILLIYTFLMVYAAFKTKVVLPISRIISVLGGIFHFIFVICYLFANPVLPCLIIGLTLIHVSAIINGLTMHRKLNMLHHIIRLLFEVGIIWLFLM